MGLWQLQRQYLLSHQRSEYDAPRLGGQAPARASLPPHYCSPGIQCGAHGVSALLQFVNQISLMNYFLLNKDAGRWTSKRHRMRVCVKRGQCLFVALWLATSLGVLKTSSGYKIVETRYFLNLDEINPLAGSLWTSVDSKKSSQGLKWMQF